MSGYGKRFRRRYNRYNRRTLSNRNIFGKTRAKAQARQIAALRNKVNKVYNACKPEIKTIVTSAETITYTSESLSSYYRAYPIASPDLGTGDKDRIGNHIKVINGVVYLSAEYFNSSDTGYHGTESSGCQVRVIIGQWKSSHQDNQIPAIEHIFEFPSNTGANYTQLAVSPLKEGITNSNAILRDVRFTMTAERNQKMLKIPFKPIFPYVWNDNEGFPNCWMMIVVSGLHYDTNFTETCKITVSDKLVFTDA